MYKVNFACWFLEYLNRNSHAHEHFTCTGTVPVPVHRYQGILRSLVKTRNTSTSLAAEEKERYTKYMTVDYMSSEQSMSESEGENAENGYESPDVERPKKKVFSVSTLPWRSPELTQVMHSLDRKLMRRRSAKASNMLVERYRSGIISSCPGPDDADAYALAISIGCL